MGANWFPLEHRIEFEYLINIRPLLGNRNIIIQDQKIRARFVQDSLPRRLGGLAATLGRISSNAKSSKDPAIVANL
ncbi:MAG: DUF5674 family protein [Chloroflexota bacterium]